MIILKNQGELDAWFNCQVHVNDTYYLSDSISQFFYNQMLHRLNDPENSKSQSRGLSTPASASAPTKPSPAPSLFITKQQIVSSRADKMHRLSTNPKKKVHLKLSSNPCQISQEEDSYISHSNSQTVHSSRRSSNMHLVNLLTTAKQSKTSKAKPQPEQSQSKICNVSMAVNSLKPSDFKQWSCEYRLHGEHQLNQVKKTAERMYTSYMGSLLGSPTLSSAAGSRKQLKRTIKRIPRKTAVESAVHVSSCHTSVKPRQVKRKMMTMQVDRPLKTTLCSLAEQPEDVIELWTHRRKKDKDLVTGDSSKLHWQAEENIKPWSRVDLNEESVINDAVL